MKTEQFVVKNENGIIRVFDTKTNVYITKPVPSEEIAKEIADDFNAMSKGDMRCVGLPDLSNHPKFKNR